MRNIEKLLISMEYCLELLPHNGIEIFRCFDCWPSNFPCVFCFKHLNLFRQQHSIHIPLKGIMASSMLFCAFGL